MRQVPANVVPDLPGDRRAESAEGKHTPGPWIADAFCTQNDHSIRVGTTDGSEHYYHRTATVCECWYLGFGEEDELTPGERRITWKEAEANAALIAAAPELLAELQTAARHIEHMAAWISKQNAGYSFESLGEDMPGIRAAIAKATGFGERIGRKG